MKRREFVKKAGLGTTLGVIGATALSAPVVAQSKKKVTIVSTWPRDFPGIGTASQRLAARITEVSDGALTTEYFAAGERVGPFDCFDEVASGNSQAYMGAEAYWGGKHPAYFYFAFMPFGMTNTEWNAWIKFNGGQDLWDEVSSSFGLKAFACGGAGTQAGGWFNKEINSSDDLKGLKMRYPGLGGKIMSKLGATTVSLPAGQINEALTAGTIDAAEFVGPYNDYFMKFYESAKYYYTGGMQEPGGGLSMAFNASWWGSLTNWEKSVIEACIEAENARSFEENMAFNGKYLKKLVDEHGVKVREFSDDTWDEFGIAAKEVFEELRGHSDLVRKIDDSFQTNLREIGTSLARFEGVFLNQRNRVLGITT